MASIFQSAKKTIAIVAISVFVLWQHATGQITNLRFSNENATYVPITGGTSLIAGASAVAAPSAVTNIGFTFNFQGVNYTQFSVNAAGLLKLGSVVVTNESGNSAITTTNTPKIYALWDAFYTGNVASGGGVSYVLSGSAPNRVLTVQWKVGYTANAATTTNFQVLLYETSNKIEFLYGAAPALLSASVGLGGVDAANDYLSIWSPNTVVTSGVNFTTNTIIPGASAGQKYTFTPTAALTTSPACLTDAPNLWLKADAGVNYTRTLLNVPAANRSSPSVYTQTPAYNPANSVLTGSPGWMPSMADGANSTPTGSTSIGAITLDLGSVQSIDGVATLGSGTAAYFTSDYTVKVSNDNVTYTTLGMFQGNESANELHYADFDATVSCRYVRVIPGAFTTYRAIRLDVYTKTATALPANNTKVSVWEDLSGNNWDASQPTTVAKQPTFLTNQFNFNPALNFPATTNILDIPDYDVALRLVVRATTLGGIPELVVAPYSPVIIHTGISGIQEMAENISYPVAPTVTQQNVAESYLATKYGITLTHDYLAGDGTTKVFDLTANAAYANNIFGIGRADCQGLQQRQSKSVNTDGLITIGNNDIIDFTNGNTASSGNNIATNSSYLLIGDNGGSLDLNIGNAFNGKYLVNRTWKLQETGTVGSVKISVPAFGNTTATATLPNLIGNLLFQNGTVYLAADNDGNFANGGTTYYAMTAVGSGATLAYEVTVDLTSASPYLRFGVEQNQTDTDADGVIDIVDFDADNDGILNFVESPTCFSTADYLYTINTISSELTQYSSYVITNAIDASNTTQSGFNTGQNWVGKEIFKFTTNGYVATPSITLGLASWALSANGTSTFKLQGSIDTVSWTDLSAAVASTATSGNLVINNTLAPTTKFKYFRILGVAGTSSYGGVNDIALTVASNFNRNLEPTQNCATDTDADTKPNHLDLDTDGDGCFDAIEAGVVATSANGMVGTSANVGVNGFADSYETTAESAVYKSSYLYDYALNNAIVTCKDSDADGVVDLNDIDADNDGILNAVESPTCFLTASELAQPAAVSTELLIYQRATNSTYQVTNSIDDNTASASAFDPTQDWVGKEIFNFTAKGYTAITGLTLNLASWALSSTTANTFKLQGSGDGIDWKDLSTAVSSTANTGSFTVSNSLAPTLKFKYFRLIGVAGTSYYGGVTNVTLNLPTYNPSANQKLTCTTDTDGDGIVNHLDLDSDGDGCFDAIEAGVLTSSADGKLPTPWGANGLADAKETVAESGIYNGIYSYDYAINNKYNLCADFDIDGIKDINDLDDDNDGILDHIESPSCFYTMAEMIKPVTISSALSQYSTNLIGYAIDNSSTTLSAFNTGAKLGKSRNFQIYCCRLYVSYGSNHGLTILGFIQRGRQYF